MRHVVVIVLILLSSLTLSGRERQDILQKEFAKPGVAESFVPGGKWFPYPAYSDRKGWSEILNKQDREFLIKRAESKLDYKWQYITASSYLEYERSGNRTEMEGYYYQNRYAIQSLVIGELLEGKGRFLPKLIDGMWFSSQQITWCCLPIRTVSVQRDHSRIQERCLLTMDRQVMVL